MSSQLSPTASAVTAVICNYQGRDYLPACLGALADLEFEEIIVVDNASTDGSVEWLRENYPAVRLIHMGCNAGPARARNAGMEASQTRWVLSLDNDAIVTPGMLAQLSSAAAQHPEAVVVTPRSVFHGDTTRVHYDSGSVHYAGMIALRNFYTPLSEAQGQGTLSVDVFVSVCVLCDRDVLLELGGYDERYFILFEDLDLSFRLRQAGHEIVAVEDAIVRHDAGTAGVSFRRGTDYPSRRVLYHSRNRWLFILKTYSWRSILVCSPGLLVYECVWCLFAITQGGLWAWMRGKGQVLGSLPASLRMRREVQARRRISDKQLLVGGPLTVTPALGQGGFKSRILLALDGILRLLFRLSKPLLG